LNPDEREKRSGLNRHRSVRFVQVAFFWRKTPLDLAVQPGNAVPEQARRSTGHNARSEFRHPWARRSHS